MKKFSAICALIIGCILLNSCTRMVAPPYTKVESIVKITPGMTASEVSSTLGIPPFDLYHMSGDGSTIHLYFYKLKKRKNKGCTPLMAIGELFGADPFYSKEENLTVGSSFYEGEQRLYVLFQNGKVSSLITDAGRKDSEDLLVQNNTIQFIAKTNRHDLNYEKLELGQQLIRLDSKGRFRDTKSDNFMSKPQMLKSGCATKSCMGKGCFGGGASTK